MGCAGLRGVALRASAERHYVLPLLVCRCVPQHSVVFRSVIPFSENVIDRNMSQALSQPLCWAENKRWNDFKNPGSQDADPFNPKNKVTGMGPGYPGLDPAGLAKACPRLPHRCCTAAATPPCACVGCIPASFAAPIAGRLQGASGEGDQERAPGHDGHAGLLRPVRRHRCHAPCAPALLVPVSPCLCSC